MSKCHIVGNLMHWLINDICAIMVIRCFPVWIVSVNLTVLSLLVYLSNKGIRFYIRHVTKYKKSCRYTTFFMLNSTESKLFSLREVPVRKREAIEENYCLMCLHFSAFWLRLCCKEYCKLTPKAVTNRL